MAERKKKQPSHWARTYIADPAVSLGKGVIGAGEAVMGLADLATNGMAGRGWAGMGYNPEASRRYLDTLYSPEQRAVNAEIESAEGIADKFNTMRRHPISSFSHTALEATPLVASAIIGGGGAVKAADKAATIMPSVAGKLATPLGQGAARLAGTSMTEGGYGAAQEVERIRRENGVIWDRPADIATRGAVDATIGLVGHGLGPGRRVVGNLRAGRPLAEGVGEIVSNDLRGGADASIRADIARGIRGLGSEGGVENVLQTGAEGMGFMPATRREREEEERKRRPALQTPSR